MFTWPTVNSHKNDYHDESRFFNVILLDRCWRERINEKGWTICTIWTELSSLIYYILILWCIVSCWDGLKDDTVCCRARDITWWRTRRRGAGGPKSSTPTLTTPTQRRVDAAPAHRVGTIAQAARPWAALQAEDRARIPIAPKGAPDPLTTPDPTIRPIPPPLPVDYPTEQPTATSLTEFELGSPP